MPGTTANTFSTGTTSFDHLHNLVSALALLPPSFYRTRKPRWRGTSEPTQGRQPEDLLRDTAGTGTRRGRGAPRHRPRGGGAGWGRSQPTLKGAGQRRRLQSNQEAGSKGCWGRSCPRTKRSWPSHRTLGAGALPSAPPPLLLSPAGCFSFQSLR